APGGYTVLVREWRAERSGTTRRVERSRVDTARHSLARRTPDFGSDSLLSPLFRESDGTHGVDRRRHGGCAMKITVNAVETTDTYATAVIFTGTNEAGLPVRVAVNRGKVADEIA